MSHAAELHRHLRLFAYRYALTRAWRGLQSGVLAGLTAALGIVLAHRLAFFPAAPAPVLRRVLLLPLLPAVLGAMWCARLDRRRLCYLLDRLLDTHNLLGSTLPLATSDGAAPRLLVARATQALRQNRCSVVLPLRLSHAGYACAAVLLLLAGSWFLPQFDLLGRRREYRETAAARATVREGLTALANQVHGRDPHAPGRNAVDELGPPIATDIENLMARLNDAGKAASLREIAAFEEKYAAEFAAQEAFARALTAARPAAPPGLAAADMRRLAELHRRLADGTGLRQAAQLLDQLAARRGNASLTTAQQEALVEAVNEVTRAVAAAGKQPGRAPAAAAASRLRRAAAARSVRVGLNRAAQTMRGNRNNPFRLKPAGSQAAAPAIAAAGAAAGKHVDGGRGKNAGPGGRGAGKGTGGAGPKATPTATAFVPVQVEAERHSGRTVEELIPAVATPHGAAATEYAQVARAAGRAAAKAMAKNRVPRHYESLVKSYFRALNERPPSSTR